MGHSTSLLLLPGCRKPKVCHLPPGQCLHLSVRETDGTSMTEGLEFTFLAMGGQIHSKGHSMVSGEAVHLGLIQLAATGLADEVVLVLGPAPPATVACSWPLSPSVVSECLWQRNRLALSICPLICGIFWSCWNSSHVGRQFQHLTCHPPGWTIPASVLVPGAKFDNWSLNVVWVMLSCISLISFLWDSSPCSRRSMLLKEWYNLSSSPLECVGLSEGSWPPGGGFQ